MKPLRTVLPYALCLLLLAACGGQKEEPAETDWTPAQMAQAVWDSQPALESRLLDCGDADFIPYLRDTLGLDPADVEDGAVLYAGCRVYRASTWSSWTSRYSFSIALAGHFRVIWRT